MSITRIIIEEKAMAMQHPPYPGKRERVVSETPWPIRDAGPKRDWRAAPSTFQASECRYRGFDRDGDTPVEVVRLNL